MIGTLRVLVVAALVAAATGTATAAPPSLACERPATQPELLRLVVAATAPDRSAAAALACRGVGGSAPTRVDPLMCTTLSGMQGTYVVEYWTPWGWWPAYIIQINAEGDLWTWDPATGWQPIIDCPPYNVDWG